MSSRLAQLLWWVCLFPLSPACSGDGAGDDDSAMPDDDSAMPDDDASDDDTAGFDPDLAEALAEALAATADEYESPGLVAAIRTGDGQLWAGAVGVSDVDQQTPMQIGDAFKIASVTKTFTAAVVLQLVGEGVLALEDTLEQWYPGFERGDEITLRHLLMHTSGVREHCQTSEFISGVEGTWTDEALVELVNGLGLLFDPGESYSYSNTNYVLLGFVIESASAVGWRTQIEDRLLSPLSLDDTRVPAEGEGWGETVSGYIGEDDYTDFAHPSGSGAAGSMVSDVLDVSAWSLQYFGKDVLQPEQATARTTDPYDFGHYAYGLGMLIIEDDLGMQWGHTGGLPGYSSWIGYRPDEDVAIAVLANCWVLDDGQMDYDWTYHASYALWEALLGS